MSYSPPTFMIVHPSIGIRSRLIIIRPYSQGENFDWLEKSNGDLTMACKINKLEQSIYLR
jgi:hypothetical protein